MCKIVCFGVVSYYIVHVETVGYKMLYKYGCELQRLSILGPNENLDTKRAFESIFKNGINIKHASVLGYNP